MTEKALKVIQQQLSTRLFAQPGYLMGMGTVLDAGGTFYTYNYSPSEARADYEAIASDWRATGYDILASIVKHRRPEL